MNEEQKELEIGDPVEIIGYGSKIEVTKASWYSYFKLQIVKNRLPDNILLETEDSYQYDAMPQMLGQTGFVHIKNMIKGKIQYSLRGVEGKLAWYCREQLKKI